MKKKSFTLLGLLLSIVIFSALISAQPDSSSLPPVPNIDEDLPAIETQNNYEGQDTSGGQGITSSSQSSSSTTILIIVIALAVIVLIALIIVVAKHRKQQGSNIQIITGSR